VGKKNLEKAIDQVKSDIDVTVEWLPFQLRDGIPEEGKPKPGGPGPHQVNARLRDVGLQSGIEFTGMCDRFPNTVKAHELLTWALETAGADVQNHLQEVLFRHYFTDGRYPDNDNLAAAAVEVGLSESEAREALTSHAYKSKVVDAFDSARRKRISGVPYFTLNGQSLGSGAQPPEAFVSALRRV